MQEMYLVFDFFSFPEDEYIAVFPFFPTFLEIPDILEKIASYAYCPAMILIIATISEMSTFSSVLTSALG
jgi:hypothetical protein